MNRIGSLKCIEAHSPEVTFEPELTIILFHGYGADAYDLQTLSDVINTRKSTRWIFPQGPLEVPIGPGWTGRAWWNIDMRAIEEAAMRGETRDLSNENPLGLDKARIAAMDMISKLKTPWNKIILGGFSQGAMLATEILLHAPENPAAAILYSGALLKKEEWKNLAPQRAGTKVFLSHGKNDLVLGHKGSQQLESLLNQAGLKAQLNSFDGGHEIPPQVIMKTNDFLSKL